MKSVSSLSSIDVEEFQFIVVGYEFLSCWYSAGVPKTHRGDIWWLLTEQHKIQYPGVENQTPSKQYSELLKDLTEYQHNILIDLGLCISSLYDR